MNDSIAPKQVEATSAVNARLALFHAEYYWSGGRGGYDEKHYVIIANTEIEALGLALEAEPKTVADNWSITKVDTDTSGAIFISERGS